MTSRSLSRQARHVAYLEGDQEPPCKLLDKVEVADEFQPAESHEEVVIRMRNLAAKQAGNLVVVFENKPPTGDSSGFHGRGRVYQCEPDVLDGLGAKGLKDKGNDAEAVLGEQ